MIQQHKKGKKRKECKNIPKSLLLSMKNSYYNLLIYLSHLHMVCDPSPNLMNAIKNCSLEVTIIVIVVVVTFYFRFL